MFQFRDEKALLVVLKPAQNWVFNKDNLKVRYIFQFRDERAI